MADIETITRVKVVPYKEKAICACGGEMRPTGYRQDSIKPQYAHECPECGVGAFYEHSYPRIVYEEVDDGTP